MNLAVDWRVAEASERHVLQAHDISLDFGSRRVLHGVSLRARPGRVLALLGPNGAGKSSLLGAMAGLCRPSSGEVRLDERPLAHWAPVELARRRAMLSQQVQLGFAFRAEEVVMLGRSPHGAARPGDADRDIVVTTMQLTRTRHLAARNYLELSGGEQQRVQLARVLAQVWDCRPEPGWLLLDEPEAGLDIAHQHELLALARRLARQGYGIIAVLHDLNLAARHADEVALLAKGRLVRHGSVDEVLDPAVLSRIYGLPLQRIAGGEGRWLIEPA